MTPLISGHLTFNNPPFVVLSLHRCDTNVAKYRSCGLNTLSLDSERLAAPARILCVLQCWAFCIACARCAMRSSSTLKGYYYFILHAGKTGLHGQRVPGPDATKLQTHSREASTLAILGRTWGYGRPSLAREHNLSHWQNIVRWIGCAMPLKRRKPREMCNL